MNRRKFLIQSAKASAAMVIGSAFSFKELTPSEAIRLTILHTNDVHSRLEPFPFDAKDYAGMGGVVARAEIIKRIREKEPHVLLLDAGDMFQGTPYFNVYKGEPEIKAMNMMGYDAATIGNHDFDGGHDNLATQIMKASFPILNCNYSFKQSWLENKCLPYKVFKRGGLKIGVLGVGLNLAETVHPSLFGNIQYNDPVVSANAAANQLKYHENCDFIICLSHLGDWYPENKMSDYILAKESYDIDLIIGGHTHKFFEKPRIYKNKKKSDVVVNQMGWGGIKLGRLDFDFYPGKNKNLAATKTVVIAEKTGD